MSDWKDHIEKYRRGKLSPSEMHELEKRALFDPFLADALEGISSVDPDLVASDLAEINRAIQPKKQAIFTPLRIAAGVVVLISAALYLFWPSEPIEVQKEIAKVDTATKSPVDTTKQLALKEEKQEEKVVTKPEKSKVTKTKDIPVPAIPKIDTASIDESLQGQLAGVTANAKTITGNVSVAEDGLPLPGVTIRVKGTTKGTTTDINGNYSLDVTDNLPLVFSFVGMKTAEVTTADKGTLDVKMNEDVAQLKEVVITRSAIQPPATEEPIVNLAEPEGGIKAYDKYMEDNLVYPEQALENNVKGRVVVEFNVGVDGALNNFVVMKSLGYGCDDEVIRLVKEGPLWKPTTEGDQPVETSVRVRIKFDPFKAKNKKKR